MRLLLDNNILVSSLISPGGPPALLADAWRDERFELVTSAEQLARLTLVLARPKIQKLIGAELAHQLIVDLEAGAMLVEPRRDVTACGDSEDNLILGTAIAGQADFVVTGDKKHLLPLKEYEGIRIATAVEALAELVRVSSDAET
jgi:hypothetical protein